MTTGGGMNSGCPGGTKPCGGTCVDTDTNPGHCGECGKTCKPDELCEAGQCASSECGMNAKKCGEGCVDITSDPKHCGDCNKVCMPNELCALGKCTVKCGPGAESCGGVCTDVSSSSKHCGKCDNPCKQGEVCTTGTCCQPGQLTCGGKCVNLDTDPDNCGGCDKKCAAEEICVLGGCQIPTDCNAFHISRPDYKDGTYKLDVDGAGPNPPFSAFCDMTSDGGGWTLVARFANQESTKRWSQCSGEWWFTKTSQVGAMKPDVHDDDMINPGFWLVKIREMKLARSDKGNGFLLKTKKGCFDSITFREKLTNFGSYTNCKPWLSTNGVLGSCDVDYGGDYLSTVGFGGAICTQYTIGKPNRLSFFSKYGSDGAVLMIGAGGEGCMGNEADHGIGLSEEGGQFASDSKAYDQRDFGNQVEDQSTQDKKGANGAPVNYALNLFVR
jgi:hypothetical protein